MKRIWKTIALLMFVSIQATVYAQVPANYYDKAQGLTGNGLRIILRDIISNQSQVQYNSIWTHFKTTDVKPNGRVWDMYSDNPSAQKPYEYYFSTDQCGRPLNEGDCYTREHVWPSALFNNAMPMYSDLHHIIPADGWIVDKKGDIGYGEVDIPSVLTSNGTKIGYNSYKGAPNTMVFEPVDEYKGDIARMLFYMTTRYNLNDTGWKDWSMGKGVELDSWAKTMLLLWNKFDPVSQKEIDRNNAIYRIQGNRNPFIDSPIYADCIFGNMDCSRLATNVSDTRAFQEDLLVFPNPANEVVQLFWPDHLGVNGTVDCLLYDLQGRLLLQKTFDLSIMGTLDVSALTSGLYTLQIRSLNGLIINKLFSVQ